MEGEILRFAKYHFPVRMTFPGDLPLFQQSPFSMVIYDLTGRAVAVNAAFEKLFGLTLDQVPGERMEGEILRFAKYHFPVRMTFPGDLPLFQQSPFSMVIYDLTGRAVARERH